MIKMEMLNKKLLKVALCVCLTTFTATMLTGCGDDTSDKKPKQKTEQKKNNKKAAANATQAAGINANVTPVKESDLNGGTNTNNNVNTVNNNGNANNTSRVDQSKVSFKLNIPNDIRITTNGGKLSFDVVAVNDGQVAAAINEVLITSIKVYSRSNNVTWYGDSKRPYRMGMNCYLQPGESRRLQFVINDNSIPNFSGPLDLTWQYVLHWQQ